MANTKEMLTKSYVLDVEELHEGAPIAITFHAVGIRKYEKTFYGIIIESSPIEVKFDYYDSKEMIRKGRGSAKRLIRRVATLEDIKQGKVSIKVLI